MFRPNLSLMNLPRLKQSTAAPILKTLTIIILALSYIKAQHLTGVRVHTLRRESVASTRVLLGRQKCNLLRRKSPAAHELTKETPNTHHHMTTGVAAAAAVATVSQPAPAAPKATKHDCAHSGR